MAASHPTISGLLFFLTFDLDIGKMVIVMEVKQYRNAIILQMYRQEKKVAERNKINGEIEKLADYVRSNASFFTDAERAERLEKLDRLIAGLSGFTEIVRVVLRICRHNL